MRGLLLQDASERRSNGRHQRYSGTFFCKFVLARADFLSQWISSRAYTRSCLL
jgi:hypothetical protein